jgi:hypothetical protein
MADFMTDQEIQARLQSLREFIAALSEHDALVVQRGLEAIEQIAHRRGLEDAVKTLDA